MSSAVARAVDTVAARVAATLASSLVARLEPLVVELVERHLVQRLGSAEQSTAWCDAQAAPATEPARVLPDVTSEQGVGIETLRTPTTLRSSGVISVDGRAAGTSIR